MMNINDLPHELLEEIFSYFIRNYNQDEDIELPKLSTVCKNFAEVIENSSRLMKGLTIVWNEEGRDAKALWESKRKYRNILFLGDIKTSRCLVKFLEQQTSITDFKFHGCTVSTYTFWIVFNLVRDTLESLEFFQMDFSHETDDEYLIPICLPNLRRLVVNSHRIINLVKLPFNLKELSLYHLNLGDEVFTKLCDILINSTDLKILRLHGDAPTMKLFDDAVFAEQAKFKLEMLSILTLSLLATSQLSNLSLFLRRQVCLKKLILWNFVVTHESLKAILNLSGLKKLELSNTTFQISHAIFAKNTSIKTLNIKYYCNPENLLEREIGICAVIKACPSVRKLKVCGYKPTKSISETIATHLKEVEILKFK